MTPENRTHLGLVGTGIALAIVALVIGAIFPLVAAAANFAFVVGIVLIAVGAAIWLFGLLHGLL